MFAPRGKRRIVRRLTVSPQQRAYGLDSATLQDANVKYDDEPTYDFYRASPRTGPGRGQKQVSDLLVDGWNAYYRWLADLKRRLPARTARRQPD